MQRVRAGATTRAARAGKAALAAGVFATIVGGWATFKLWRADHLPLPGLALPQGPCALWFVGSSSMHRWQTLGRDMRPWQARNRGVDGATVNEVAVRFANEDDAPAPAAIVVYLGENDIAGGVPAAEVADRIRGLIATKTDKYGALPMLIVSLKPSPSRWANLPEQTAFNAIMRRTATGRPDLTYVDLVPRMLVGGRPGPFYRADGIHMNARGYARWADSLHLAIRSAVPAHVADRCAGEVGRSA